MSLRVVPVTFADAAEFVALLRHPANAVGSGRLVTAWPTLGRMADLTPVRGADERTAHRAGSTEDYRLAVDVLAALAQHVRAGTHEVDDYGAFDSSGRSWWIRFRRKAGR